MMRRPLTVGDIASRAERLFGDRPVLGRRAGPLRSSTYGEVVRRARRLCGALASLGVEPGDRVASFGWNSVSHLELYLAVPAMGCVLHTLNIRLHPDDVSYIADHAGDSVVFVDASLAEQLPELRGVSHEVIVRDGPGERPGAIEYEELLERGSEDHQFQQLDEDCAAVMCYTSGTTGRPKGIVYSHRSIGLYCLMANQPDAFGIREADVVMPIVPMFHANAWGFPYIATMTGAGLVMPGPAPGPADLAELIGQHGVTVAAAVPTVWQGILELDRADLSSLREAIGGGSAVPESLIRDFDQRFGVSVVQGWGMTETSPLATIARHPVGTSPRSDAGYALRARQGRPLAFLEADLDTDAGGELLVRANTVARGYYGGGSPETFTADGWLRTGDIAEIDESGSVRLVDRTKDLIKSGGEWISSVELENAAVAHPGIAEAAAVAAPDRRWGERPWLYAVRVDEDLEAGEVVAFLESRLARWWAPDRVEFVAELPKTSVGKLDKKVLRARVAAALAEGRGDDA